MELITNTIKSLDLLPLSIWEWVEENNCTKEATRGIMGNGKKEGKKEEGMDTGVVRRKVTR